MDYYLDSDFTLYYRINQNFFWTPCKEDDVLRMMCVERQTMMNNLDCMMSNQLNSPNAHPFQLMEWQYGMLKRINECYNSWNLNSYKVYLVSQLTSAL
jgi:hypothetical protein